MKNKKQVWDKLSQYAWKARENAFLFGETKVGCALLSEGGEYFVGCNVEHQFRSHDIHAEVNAISSMISGGATKFTHILIVAKRDNFTPCGSCMDWVMQHGGKNAKVGFQNEDGEEIQIYLASELMPHYPS